MIDSWETWEGLAAEAHGHAGAETPVNAFVLASRMHFDVEAWEGRGAELDERRRIIRVSTRARPQRRHGLVAHELGHYLLRLARIDSEDGARYLAGALMLPRQEFARDVTRTAWGLARLRELHVNASAQMVATRIVQVRDAVATIIDRERVTSRVSSPWLVDPRLAHVSRWERALAQHALEAGEEVRGDALCYAIPLVEGAHHRVIVVCEAEQLSLRLEPART